MVDLSTTFYFGTTLSPRALSGTQSVWSGGSFGTVDIWSGVNFIGQSNNANSGQDTRISQFSSQVQVLGVSVAQTTSQAQFIQSFVSPSLAGNQALNSGTIYTVVLGALGGSVNANFLQSGAAAIVYKFPAANNTAAQLISSGFVSGFIVAGGASAVSESGTIIGLGASGALNSGDRLVLELWWISGQQSKAANYTNRINFASGDFGFFRVNQIINLAVAMGAVNFPLQPQIVRGY